MGEVNWLEVLANTLFASFGGIISILVDNEKKSRRKKMTIGQYISKVTISFFGGFLVYALCVTQTDLPFIAVMAITGAAGFAGSPAVNALVKLKLKLVGASSDQDGKEG